MWKKVEDFVLHGSWDSWDKGTRGIRKPEMAASQCITDMAEKHVQDSWAQKAEKFVEKSVEKSPWKKPLNKVRRKSCGTKSVEKAGEQSLRKKPQKNPAEQSLQKNPQKKSPRKNSRNATENQIRRMLQKTRKSAEQRKMTIFSCETSNGHNFWSSAQNLTNLISLERSQCPLCNGNSISQFHYG